MKNSPLHLGVLSILFWVTSCQKTDFAAPQLPDAENPETGIVLTPNEAERIPLFETEMNRSTEEVLALAEGLIRQLAREEQQTKGSSSVRQAVLSDSLVIPTSYTTKSCDVAENETKIYLVQFGDRSGSAWIAGDKRVRTAVLAYSGESEFDRNTDNPGAQLAMEYMERYVLDEIERLESMRGDSIYRSLETRYGFGAARQPENAFVPTKAFQQPQEMYPLPGLPGSSPDNPYGTKEGSNWQVVQNGIIWYWAPVDKIVNAESSNRQEVMTLVYPLLPSQWGQNWPYNVEIVKEHPDCPTGCIATAMAQIMNFHKKPAGYMWDNYGYNLRDKIFRNQELAWETKSSSVIDNIGLLFKSIGSSAGLRYAPSVTSGYTEDVPNAFAALGYSCSSDKFYNLYEVEDELKNARRPLYMSGTNSEREVGHAWVVDGLSQVCNYTLQYQDCYYQNEYVGHIKAYTINYTTDEKYLHCNWGWNGLDDGWYVAGIFNPPSHDNFKEYKRIITNIR